MIVNKILEGITNERREKSDYSPIRMSSAGKCQRAIAYQLHGFEGEPLPSRSIMVFRLGDTIEKELKSLIQKYYPDQIEYPEEPCKVIVAGKEIHGHIDGMIKNPKTILEIKSINTMAFKRLGTEVSYDYQCQAVCYMKAHGLTKTLFIFYNKDTSHLQEIEVNYSEDTWNQIVQRFTNVIKSTKDNLPSKEYGPDDKGKLDWHCSYCSFNKTCWPEAKLQFDKNNKPQMIITKEK